MIVILNHVKGLDEVLISSSAFPFSSEKDFKKGKYSERERMLLSLVEFLGFSHDILNMDLLNDKVDEEDEEDGEDIRQLDDFDPELESNSGYGDEYEEPSSPD